MMFKEIKNLKIKLTFFISLLVVVCLVISSKVYAASLSLLPNSSTVSAGNIIPLKVYISTDGQVVNNTEASIQFPTDMLEVVSITKNSSIFTLWVEEPNFSNSSGKITFSGGIPNPGYIGQSGYVATITFKAKKQGTASIIFIDGAIRANDGLGTDITTAKNGSVIQIGIPKEKEIPIIANKNNLPLKPIIISDTHPNQDIWYNNDTANFNWKISSGITSLKTLFNKISDSTPTIAYDNSVTQKTLNNITDGISYFHLRYFNSSGGSLVSHYKVKIDKTSPLAFIPAIRIDNGQNIIKLNAEDAISGVDYYTIQIDSGFTLKVKKEELINNEYILPVQKEGEHYIIVAAYDKAGNNTESELGFISPTITSPILSLSLNEITTGESVTINGKTDYPNKQVNIILEENGREIGKYIQTTSVDGTFYVATGKLKNTGSISIWAETILSDSVKSASSQKVYLKIIETPVVKITLSILYLLFVIIIIIFLLLIIFMLLYLGWHKYFGLKKKIKEESLQIAEEIHKAMLLFKEELNEQLEALEKVKKDRSLNKKEESIFNEIQKNIDSIDSFIEKKFTKY